MSIGLSGAQESEQPETQVLKTATEWMLEPEFYGIVILDPDGWRHPGMSWDDKITSEEFAKRQSESTQIYMPRSA